MRKSDVKQLSLYPLFKDLSEKELKLILAIVKKDKLDSGSLIIKEDDYGDDLYLLEEGVVDIHKTLTIVTSKHDFGTKERTLIRLTGDDHCYFGEMALLGDGKRSATVKAVTECKLGIIKNSDFLKLCEKEPRIGYIVLTNIALILSDYLRKTNEDIIKLTTALSLSLSGEK